jgi:hypothetical protein
LIVANSPLEETEKGELVADNQKQPHGNREKFFAKIERIGIMGGDRLQYSDRFAAPVL